ncbi:hypothetical protein MKW92_035278 [Papaver armeniacum]|nr:hypothetical protein MKW92_035278 [Papaver armeniacum]
MLCILFCLVVWYLPLRRDFYFVQPAKKIYESLFGDGVNASALPHIQFIRFLRRTEGVEAAHKYFLDARKSPNCRYHVFVAWHFVAHNVFEAGLKRFMHEPGYILDLTHYLSIQVEQRRKEALSRTGEDGSSAFESSLRDVVSRYIFMDLWPCSSQDLDYLARQEWLVKNINKKAEKSILLNGVGSIGAEKGSAGLLNIAKTSTTSAKVIYPDTSRMIIYDLGQKQVVAFDTTVPGLPAASNSVIPAPSAPLAGGTGTTKALSLNEILKVLPLALVAFVTHFPSKNKSGVKPNGAPGVTGSQTASSSGGGSVFSGELSGSTE